MAGKWTKSEEQLKPDPRFNDRVLAKFINCVMHQGKKSVAQRVMYDALDQMQVRYEKEKPADFPPTSIEIFNKAIENAKPNVEVRSKRVGGANYQVPIEVPQNRRTSLAMRWIITNARTRPEKGMAEKLANELNDAANLRGGAIKKRDDVHRMAEANKAFAHYRW
jgi:small subunit ribosomal protein S7